MLEKAMASRVIFLVTCLLLSGAGVAATQPAASPPKPGSAPVAFVNVHVISMESSMAIAPRQTVLIEGDRITGIGPVETFVVPADASIIDGQGRYLVPGLVDAHVHLTTDMPWAPTRRDFGDAPLYLAHGVTTVINLRGTATELEWRDRIARGELVGPTIYTAGEFINEPLVRTPADVTRAIHAQHDAGYDLIKFHEAWTPEAGLLTTTGLDLESYHTMNEVARTLGMPLVGHAPGNLGLDALIEARQPLAHLGALSSVYFLPAAGHLGWLIATALAFGALALIGVAGFAAAIHPWRRTRARVPLDISIVRMLVGLELLAASLAALAAAAFLPGGPMFASDPLRLVFTGLVLVLTAAAAGLLIVTPRVWRDAAISTTARVSTSLAAVASVGLVAAALFFWTPVAWRSSHWGIERLAARLQQAGIPVQTTLVAYDAIGGPGRVSLARDPTVGFLHADAQAVWRRIPRGAPPGYRYRDFLQSVAGALHRAGVPLIAGTDAMGVALVAPGSSLHRELALLVDSGMTPYDALRAATVAPAAFLGQGESFGTIAIGRRADLLLLDRSPVENIAHLRNPRGVMAQGRWFTREDLQDAVRALSNGE